MTWTSFRRICPNCGTNNRPDQSPKRGIALAVFRLLPPCKECGHDLNDLKLPRRPLTQEVIRTGIEVGLLYKDDRVKLRYTELGRQVASAGAGALFEKMWPSV